MIGTILGAIFCIIIAIACCASTGDSSQPKTTQKRSPPARRNVSYGHYDYGECPSCGAPYYDGYCDECGYPDVNQGWLGEEYG